METTETAGLIKVCGYCGLTTTYDWVTCPHCDGWTPPNSINLEVKIMLQYQICPYCGGYKWKWEPYPMGSDDGTSSVSDLEPCRCIEPKPEVSVTVRCPHCGGYVVLEVKGSIRFDFTQTEEV